MRIRLVSLAFSFLGFAFLATGGGIALSPLVTEIVLPPGSSYQDVIMITNTGDEPVIVTAQALGFIAPEGIPRFLTPDVDRYPFSGRDLLEIQPKEKEVGPGETAYFTYVLHMPEELEPFGGRYVAAVFQAFPKEVGEAQVIVTTRVASIFLVSPGTGAAPHFTFNNVRIYQSDEDPRKIILEAEVTNDGNLHVSRDQIIGWIYVTDVDGYLIDSFQVETHTMLPGNKYVHREVWTAPQDLLPGTYQFHLDLLVFAPVGQKTQQYHLSLPVELSF